MSSTIYEGAPGEPPGRLGLEKAIQKAGIKMTAAEYIAKRDSLSRLVSTEIWNVRIREGQPRKGNYVFLNYMKVHNPPEYVKFESEVWRPLAAQFIKQGEQSGWVFATALLPGGTDLKYSAYSADIFPTWKATLDVRNMTETFKKAHPGKDQQETMGRLTKLRDLGRRDLLVIEAKDLYIRSALAAPGSTEIVRFFDKRRTEADYTHIFSQSFIYEAPFGRGKPWAQSGVAAALLGGWQMNGLLLMQSGAPLNITAPNTPLNTSGHDNFPNLVGEGQPEIFGKVGPGQRWFDITRFSAAPALTFGNLGRHILSGPGVFNLDGSLFRRFRIREGLTLEFRMEALNVTNTPIFANPNVTLGNPAFGQVTTSNRKVQFGLKLSF